MTRENFEKLRPGDEIWYYWGVEGIRKLVDYDILNLRIWSNERGEMINSCDLFQLPRDRAELLAAMERDIESLKQERDRVKNGC